MIVCGICVAKKEMTFVRNERIRVAFMSFTKDNCNKMSDRIHYRLDIRIIVKYLRIFKDRQVSL